MRNNDDGPESGDEMEQADGSLRLVDHAGEDAPKATGPTAHICWSCGTQYTLKAGEPNVGRCVRCYVGDKL